MIVHCYPADDHGCGFYRIGAPAQILRGQGHDITIHPASANEGLGMVTDTQNGNVLQAIAPPGTDVVVLQRVNSARMVQVIGLLRKQGIAVVVDMDDDLDRIDPNNPVFAAYHPRYSGKTDRSWVQSRLACIAATVVTVSTDALLARYAPHGRGVVLPNRIPFAALGYEREDSPDVGWAGHVGTHPQDLQVVGAAVARLQSAGVEYRGVGPVEGLKEALGLHREFEVTGKVPIEHWLRAVATIGVGMAPLADTDFNAAKSWLKVLEMSAVGVPWVASPRAEYRRFSSLYGVGLLADKPKDWFKALKLLCNNPAIRAEESERGRAAARANTYEDHAWRWAEVWHDAMMFERRAQPVFRGIVTS